MTDKDDFGAGYHSNKPSWALPDNSQAQEGARTKEWEIRRQSQENNSIYNPTPKNG